jgi:DNA-binding NtrC family response regulator
MTESLDRRNPGSRILIVEDDFEMRGLLSDELIDEGYEVTQAVDGQDATEKLINMRFDLVITDVVMPKMGGMDLLTDMQNNHLSIPVIVITAFGDACSPVQAYKNGASHYLYKPFKTKELKEAVRKVLARA